MVYFEQVINYEMPQTAAGYVHRIGRTGRAYNAGASVSLVSTLKICLRSLMYNCDFNFSISDYRLCVLVLFGF